MILGDVIKRVQRQFGDDSGIQITRSDIIRWVNDAQRDLVVNNNLLQVKATAAATVNVSEYPLPADVLQMRSVKHDGRVLRAMSQAEIDTYIINFDNTSEYPSGTPQLYGVWAGVIHLWPAPDTMLPTGLILYYVRQPAVITEADATPDNTVLDLPAHYHNAIRDYCLKMAYELDDNWNAADRKSQQFQQASTELKNPDILDEFYPHITSTDEFYAC